MLSKPKKYSIDAMAQENCETQTACEEALTWIFCAKKV